MMNAQLYQDRRLKSITAPSAAVLRRLAAQLVRPADRRIWLLSGPLGAGKTTFVRGALRGLGVRGRVTSPTFTLVKHYRLRGKRAWAVHIDAYRITSAAEVAALELPDVLAQPGGLVLVEWPENLPGIRWPAAALVQFSITPSGRRLDIRRWVGGRLVPARVMRRQRSRRRR